MSEPEQLEKSQPAEIHVDGIPQYAGDVSIALDQGLVLTDARPMRGKLSGALNIHPGTKGDLVFLEMFDDDGGQLIIPITLEGSESTNLTISFRDRVSVITGTVLKKLRSKTKIREAPTREESNELLPELKKRSLRQLDKVVLDFLMALSDHLFDLSSRPSARDQQEELYESMNINIAENNNDYAVVK
jgi:hypothetical protein